MLTRHSFVRSVHLQVFLAAALYFWFAPIMHRSLVLGQTTPIMVLLLAAFYALARRGRSTISAIVLGAICLVKIPPLALVGVVAALGVTGGSMGIFEIMGMVMLIGIVVIGIVDSVHVDEGCVYKRDG